MFQVTLLGGCLCGSVQYQVKGEIKRLYHCHCSRCRKSSGAAHASNLLLTNAEITFTAGEELLKFYKLPASHRFGRQFCTHCGSNVPRFVPEINSVVIPAGSLDSDIPIKATARIFWDSRAEWSCDGDELPRHAEYPEQ